ncbi:MAG: M56 family metallopeptidase [Verrucomicrobiota bacterium]
MNLLDTSTWPGLLAVLALESAAVVTLAHAVSRWSRNPAASRRAWQATLVALCLLPVVEASGLRGLARSMVPVRVALDRSDPTPEAPAAEVQPAGRTPDAAVGSEALDTGVRLVAQRLPRPLPSDAPATWPWWVWSVGAVVVLARALRSRRALSLASRGAMPADNATTEAVDRLATRIGLGTVRVVSWDGLETPVAYGVVRPTVALPSDWAVRHGEGDRDAMLAHELAHLAGRDPAWMAMADVACAVLWWHPGAWWASRRLRAACERAADAAASIVPGGRAALAEVLVRLGREWEASGLLPRLGIDGGRFRSELGQRVEELLGGAAGWRSPGRWDGLRPVALAGVVAIVAMALPLPADVSGGLVGRLGAQGTKPSATDTSSRPASGTASARAIRSSPSAPSAPSAPAVAAASPSGTSDAGDQVLLSCLFVEARGDAIGDLGLDWVFGRQAHEGPAVVRTNLPGSRGYVDTWHSQGEAVVLGPEQFRALRTRMDDWKPRAELGKTGLDILSAPKATTLAGRAVSVASGNEVNVVTGASGRATGGGQPGITYSAEPMRFGIEVQLVPTRPSASGPWTLDVVASVREFKGYADPGKEGVLIKAPDGSTQRGTPPIPVIKARVASGQASLPAGSTLALRGPITETVEVRKAGLFRRATTNVTRSRLFIFATLDQPAEPAAPVVLHPAPDDLRKTESRLWSAAFSPDGSLLAPKGGWDHPVEPGCMFVWDVTAPAPSGRPRWIWKQRATIRKAAFSPQGNLLAFGDFDGVVRVLDVATGKRVLELAPFPKLVNSMAFTPDGRRLVVGGFDESVHVVEVPLGRILHSRALGEGVTSVAASADGRWVAATTWVGNVHLLELDGLRPVGEGEATFDAAKTAEAAAGPRIAEWIVFTPDAKGACTGNWDGTIQRWDVTADGLRRRAPLRRAGEASPGTLLQGPGTLLQGGALSPDGLRLAVGMANGAVEVWDLRTGRVEGAMPAHGDLCFGLAFSPDGSRLATVGWDRKTRVWDVATRRRLLEW